MGGRREGRGKRVNERGREGEREAGREGGRESNRMGGNYITSHDAQYSCVHVPKFHAQLHVTTKMLKTTHNTRYRKYMYMHLYMNTLQWRSTCT